mgnify:CR=1 FL=1
MNENEFLELLNLYLDHEISPADAVRLEHEVQTNVHRRALYHEYCRLQKACRMLSADFRQEATGFRGTTGGKVVAFDAGAARRTGRVGSFVAGSLAAAAACITLVLVFVEKPPTATDVPAGRSRSLAEQTVPVRVISGGTETMVADRVTPRGLIAVTNGQGQADQPTLMLVSESLVLSGNKQSDAVFSASMQQADDQLAWIRNFQLVSLKERTQLDQLRFESAPASLRPEGRQLLGRAPTEATVEMTAFRIIK